MKKLKRHLMVVLIVTLVLTVSPGAFAASDTSNVNLEYLKNVMDMIKEQYNGQISDSQLLEGALKGMFNTMDPYTVFFNPQESNEFLSEVGGKYEGIGVALNKAGDYIIVSKVFAASPAEKAGIEVGDKIVAVNGKNIIGASLEETVTHIRGQAGTEVALEIVKKGQSNITSIKVQRAQIKVNPVTYDIRHGIGYIKIDSFNSNTEEYLIQALNEIDKNNITKIVLDLRNNPGGDLDQAINVARKFVPEGLITKLSYKSDRYKNIEYHSSLKTPKYTLAVLVNEMSASASEILAGAIQDKKVGTLIGTKTYGKGRVQALIPLLTPEAYAKYEKQVGAKLVNAYDLLEYGVMPLESEVIGRSKITIAEYLTPNLRKIDNIGLEPDHKVSNYTSVNDVDINSIQKLTKTSKPKINSEGLDIYNAEKILAISGYNVDKPDFKLDQKTFAAIKKFQQDSGFTPYGTLDFTTQQALNDKLDKLVLEIDKQYKKAVEVLNGN